MIIVGMRCADLEQCSLIQNYLRAATCVGKDLANGPVANFQFFALKFPPPVERSNDSEAHRQAGFGSCFSEIDTGASESFLLNKFIAA